ncbi:MAG: hypothetical protein HKP58_04820 [Desulfatitalea sp.]|nr:hypothetical protein [Desulfatitalea sp.]NNJ99715.1 hypothetical protein [Desulfatitalea sp.]
MKKKVGLIFLIGVVMCVLYSIAKDEPCQQIAKQSGFRGKITQPVSLPNTKEIFEQKRPPKEEFVVADESKWLQQHEELVMTPPDEDEIQLEDSLPHELPGRDALPVEQVPTWIENAQEPYPVDILEIELTDSLLGYDISDEQIDTIFDKIRGGEDTPLGATGTEADAQLYKDRLGAVINLMREADLDSQQLTAAINDIFRQTNYQQ